MDPVGRIQALVELVLDALALKKLERDAQAAVEKGTNPAKGIKNLNLLGGAIGRVAGMLGVAFTAGAAFRKFIEETSAAQKAHAQLEAVIRSTGGAAGKTVEDIEGLSSSLARTTAFGDDAISAMQGVLLTFTQIRGDQFNDATGAILDMSQALGTDLQGAAIQVGKALNDPVKGITALQRVGVSFTESQKEVIKGLVETGRVAEAQGLILKELQVEFGGSAEAFRKTLPGALAALRNEWDNLFEVSQGSTTGIVAAIEGLIAFLPKIRDFVNTIAKGWAAIGIHSAVLVEQLKLVARALDPRRLWSDEAQERFEQQQENLERTKEAAMDMMFELEHGAPPAAAATRDVAAALGEESESAEDAAERIEKLRKAEDARITMLIKGHEIMRLTNAELRELIRLNLQATATEDDATASLEERLRNSENAARTNAALGLGQRDVSGQLRFDLRAARPSLAQVGERTTEDLVSREGEFTKFFLDNLSSMQSAAELTAIGIQDAFSQAFTNLVFEGEGLGSFFTKLFKGIAGAGIAGLAEIATRKVTENAALAIENVGKGLAANALIPGSGAPFFAAAKVNALAVAKWALLAGGAAAVGGALQGGSEGGGGSFRGGDVTGRAIDRVDQVQPQTNIYIDGFDPRSPAHVELIAAGIAEANRTYGGMEPNVRIYPRQQSGG